MLPKAMLLVVSFYSSLAPAADAPVQLSPDDLAYVAARQIQLGQNMAESLCGRTKFRKDVERRHAAFLTANPEFSAALSAEPADPEARTQADALIKRYQDGLNLLTTRASSMPPEMFCASTLQREPGSFAASVESLRNRLANPLFTAPIAPAAPADADANATEVPLSTIELREVVLEVLENVDVAKYLHPDEPGRLPVSVALAAPYKSKALDLTLYGQPIREARVSDRSAVQLGIRATAASVKVTVAYAPEGIEGTIRLAREGATWRTIETKIYE